MRPVILKISAFGPYAKQQILNFEDGLAGSNLFLIHGVTGAGKTSILDAMLFALYGSDKIGNGRNGRMMRSEHADDRTPTEVDFTFALGEKVYRVKRTYSPDLKNSSAELHDLNSGDVIIKNVSSQIEELIGFGSEQFRQVILLQQGEFKKFLFAKTNDRQKILDVLFNAGFYKVVEERLKSKADLLDIELRGIQKQHDDKLEEFEVKTEEELSNLMVTNKEELDKSQQLMNQLDKLRKETRDELEKGRAQYQQFKELEEKTNRLAIAQKILQKTQSDLQVAKAEYDKQNNFESKRKLYERDIEELSKIRIRIIELQKSERNFKIAEEQVKTVTNELEMLNKTVVAYEGRLEELVNETKKFSIAAADFEKYNMMVKECEVRDKLAEDVEKLNKQIEILVKNCSFIEKKYVKQRRDVERLKQLSRVGRAALLAKDLKDGEPCPVCGSTVHPKLAVSEDVIPTDEEIEHSELELDRITRQKSEVDSELGKYQSRLQTQQEALTQKGDLGDSREWVKKRKEAQLAKNKFIEAENNFHKGQGLLKEVKDKLNAKKEEHKQATELAATLSGSIKEKESQIPPQYRAEDGNKNLESELKNSTLELKKMIEDLHKSEQSYHHFEKQLSANKSTVAAIKEAYDKLAKVLQGEVKPDIDELQRKSIEADKVWAAQNEKTSNLVMKSERLEKVTGLISKMKKQINQLTREFAIWSNLSKVANGNNAQRMKFQTYVLNSVFRDIIHEANQRLKIMSDDRYRLEYKVPEKVAQNKFYGLDFEIYDEFTGTTRPVETLSGGESFLASLSLALGLADVVQNNAGGIKLDTIFIDEGFGSLDSDTLDMTIRSLNDLQKDGRLVGIISHVEELKQQISSKLEVIKGKSGSYARFVQ